MSHSKYENLNVIVTFENLKCVTLDIYIQSSLLLCHLKKLSFGKNVKKMYVTLNVAVLGLRLFSPFEGWCQPRYFEK